MQRTIERAFLIGGVFLLSACGGGGNAPAAGPAIVPAAAASVAPVTAAASPSTSTDPLPLPLPSGAVASASNLPENADARVPVVLTYKLPASQATSALERRPVPALGTARRLPEYISPANTKFAVTVTPAGGTAAGPYNGSCFTGSCTVSFTASVGANTIAVKLTDTPGTVLSAFTTTQIVQPTTINTLNFTANPVINRATVTLASSTLNAGTAASDVVTVNGLDASGNIIAGVGNYVNANGAPIRLTVSLTKNTAGGRGEATLSGPQILTGPIHPPLVLQYDGNWLSTATVAVTASQTLPAGTSSATMTTNPRAVEYSVGLAADTLAMGPDGYIWYSSFNDSGIGKFKPGAGYTNYTSGYSGSALQSITPGPDGNMWFSEYFGGRVGRITTTGQITEFSGVPGSAMQIVSGSDGRMWSAVCGSNCTGSGSYVTAMKTDGSMQTVSTNGASGNAPSCITAGPDGNVWVGYQGANIISKISPGFTETDYTYSQPNGFRYTYCAVTTGSDGNIWFTDPSQWAIGRVTIGSGAVTIFSTGITSDAGISSMVNGPDANLWFTESNQSLIAKITPTGTVTEYGTANGVPSGASVSGIIVGPDGNLWFADPANNKIGKFVL